jgi:hypothetical protein
MSESPPSDSECVFVTAAVISICLAVVSLCGDVMPPQLEAFFHENILALYRVWKWLDVPPRGDAGLILSAFFLLGQWFIIGLLFGLLRCFLRRMRKRSAVVQPPPNSKD